MALPAKIYITGGRYSNFYVYRAKFQKENCRQSTSKIELAMGTVWIAAMHFCYTCLPKKEGKKKERERVRINVLI
jgi:hypothetical protein